MIHNLKYKNLHDIISNWNVISIMRYTCTELNLGFVKN